MYIEDIRVVEVDIRELFMEDTKTITVEIIETYGREGAGMIAVCPYGLIEPSVVVG